MTCLINRPTVSGSAEAFSEASPILPTQRTQDHTQLVLEYPEETPAKDIADRLAQIPDLRWRVSGFRALLRWHKRQGLLRKLVVCGQKPLLRRPPPFGVWCSLGPEITNMDSNLSATRFVDTSLPMVEVQDLRARVFVAEFASAEIRPILEGLASIDPDLVWEARGGRVLVLRGATCPRRKALKTAFKGARLLQYKGRPSMQNIRRAFGQPSYWTNARSDADWDAEIQSPGTTSSSEASTEPRGLATGVLACQPC